MPATSSRTSRVAAQKKAVEAPAIIVEPPSEAPSDAPSLDDAVLNEVMAQFDCSEIIVAIAQKMAPRLATTIKVDDLATYILERRQEKLSAQLVEKLVEKLSG